MMVVMSLAEAGIDPLVYLFPDSLDEPFGHRCVIAGAEIPVSGHGRGNFSTRILLHADTIFRVTALGQGLAD